MKRILMLAGVLAMFSAAAAQAQTAAKADPAKAQQLVTQVCAACHGADGNSVVAPNPSLAGQQAEYIAKQLANFKSGERKSAVMMPMTATLTPDDMRNLGAYFSEQKAKSGVAKDKDLVIAGQKIYRGGNAANGLPACGSCHGPAGMGVPVQYPRLAGQRSEYTLTQLQNFRSGERANDNAKVMRVIAGKLSDQDMKAVSEYIAGLR